MSKKFIIGIIVLILILISGGYVAKKYLDNKNQTIPPNSNQEVKTNKTLYTDYLNEAIEYRTAGFQGDTEAFYKAIDSYKKATEIFKGEMWVPYLNLGNTYQLVNDYKSAEEAYTNALEISPKEASIYLAKIEMYRFKLNKSNSEVDKVYNEALKEVADNANVIISYAAFLRDTDKNQEALKYYKILEEKYPDNQTYKDEISDILKKLEKM